MKKVKIKWLDFYKTKPINNGNGLSDVCLFYREVCGDSIIGRAIFSEDDNGNEFINYVLATSLSDKQQEAYMRLVSHFIYLKEILPN